MTDLPPTSLPRYRTDVPLGEVLAPLAEAVRRRVEERRGTANCCVQATVVARHVLESLGHRSVELPVHVTMHRYRGHEHANAGGTPLLSGSLRPAASERQDGRWVGHLVAVVDGHLVDPTASQFRLQGATIDQPVVVAGAEQLLRGEQTDVRARSTDGKLVIAYALDPGNDGYLEDRSWTDGGAWELVCRAVLDDLERAGLVSTAPLRATLPSVVGRGARRVVRSDQRAEHSGTQPPGPATGPTASPPSAPGAAAPADRGARRASGERGARRPWWGLGQ